ncbi:MAG: sigma-54 dependent transcriptional regulator [Rikenellaceae bacterium]|nr:sigma-54 dependent transcriptional regulator [Rikenellaceae bacterium]
MKKEGTIVVVDDNRSMLTAVEILLNGIFEKVVTLGSPNRLLTTLREVKADVLLLDMNFSSGINSGNEGLYWLSEVKKADPSIEVVLFTAYADIDLAVKAMQRGATDFVVKPWNNAKLVATLQAALALRKSRSEAKQLGDIKRSFSPEGSENGMFWGTSPAMRRLRAIVEKVADTDANILITGENGTGKEMLAREIHRLSARKDELIVTVDLGAIPETLFESELFGHIKGAFTDARTDRAGKFEAASNGTLFLDEIGNLPYHQQAKLLTAIQSRSIVRVGSNAPIPVNIRLISATNRDLNQMVAAGEFREDLLYRINTIHIEIPPLAQRTEDIVPLAQIFLKRYAAKYNKTCAGFDDSALDKMIGHNWSGNIRELQHTVEKAVIMADGELISADELLISRREGNAGTQAIAPSTLEEMERSMIANALQRHGGNLSAVAAQLGVTRQTLYNKIKKYNL